MKKTFFCIDAHTCGNPVRLVAGGGPSLEGRIKNFEIAAGLRGPLVYCAEWPDHDDKKVLNLVLKENAPVKAVYDPAFFNGMYLLEAQGQSAARVSPSEIKTSDVRVKIIPYFAWAHRGAGEMMVWVPSEPGAAQPTPAPTVASLSEISASHRSRTLMALNDGTVHHFFS